MEQVPLARVAVSAATFAFDKPYDYLISPELKEKVRPGVRLMVPFGRGNKSVEALVLSVWEGERTPEMKWISAVLDDAPVLDQAGMRLAFWMRERYFCTIYDAVRTILPAGLWYRIRETDHLTGALTEEETARLLGRKQRAKAAYDEIVACGGQAELETLEG